MLDSFLTTLAEELELGQAPQKDPSNQFRLQLNQTQSISLKEEGEHILFRAQIHSMPQDKQEELCLYLMKGNFLGQGTGRSVIGLSEDEKFLTLSLLLPYDMNYKTFKLLLEEFANYLSYWQEEITSRDVRI